MPYVTYPNLGDIYKPDNLSLLPTMIGFQREEEAQKNNLLNQLAAEQEYAQNQQMNPLRVQNEQELLKQRQLANDFEEKKKPLLLQELGNKANSLKQDQLTQLGGMMYQVGKAVEASGGKVPLEMEAHLPKEITNLLSQPDGYKQAIAFGEQIMKGSPKMYSQTQKEESAADILRKKLEQKSYEAEQDRLSRERIAAARLENARKLISMRPMKQTKESFESHAVELEKAADDIELDRPQAASALREKARYWMEQAKAKAAASASTNATLKRDTLKGFGIDIPDSSQPGKEQDPYAGFKIR